MYRMCFVSFTSLIFLCFSFSSLFHLPSEKDSIADPHLFSVTIISRAPPSNLDPCTLNPFSNKSTLQGFLSHFFVMTDLLSKNAKLFTRPYLLPTCLLQIFSQILISRALFHDINIIFHVSSYFFLIL